MGRNLTITIAAIFSLAIAGCASEETPQAIEPTPIPKIAKKSQTAAQSFKNPVIPAKQVSQVSSPSLSLIQSTNPTERARIVLVSKNRTDPFAQIFGQTVTGVPKTSIRPVPVLPKLPTASIPGRKLPTSTIASNQKKNTVAVVPKKANATLTSVLPKVLPQVVPNPTLVSVLPPAPQPDLARAVVVTGVVLITKEPQAIIKVPDEPTSRYVQAGQRLANGVLIKRIEMNGGSNPIVILEQNGIEVAKMVGEGPVNSTPSAATPSAASATGNPILGTTAPQNPINVGAS
ncbi:hypothetical protein VF14_02040 [Nostoc linckia z18]|jgi:hypothetical protein|uniref:Uncharacterized protein n=2 Tax=Nostoc linckia TaxID=92942 RepID=A0A9Q5ZGT3_NOSLI|nr:hypothetical protein [Nostoc linckia]PHK40342.1 hypothetical protein VF12_10830 [Nostoc linckia z15]PHK48223.1 hypothetical protein VF13_01480 [Nostoc linckia z16]PHJ68342.1 hypothetical protein VF02_03270 [Nostoc linckia z1]PHJ73778.1 hypothetical protein VF05_00685 [Nostoc linckia z3]PHJ78347.1 hypothetical protein VF03_02090 [Nostoc linckia z2]